MMETTKRYGIYEADPTKFGGIIYPSDYTTDYRGKNSTKGSPIASRIMQDQKFDNQCKNNKENRETKKRYDAKKRA